MTAEKRPWTPPAYARKVQATICPNCRATIFRGLDHDRHAAQVDVDVTPLGPVGEARSLIEGRRTFDLHRDGDRYVIDLREIEHIQNWPAGTRAFHDVLALHKCGARQFAHTEIAQTKLIQPEGTAPSDDTPPF